MAALAVPAEAERAHEVVQAAQPAGVLRLVLGELHQQQGLGRALDEALQRRAEQRDLAGQRQHGGVDEFDGDGLQRHQVLGGVHGLEERAEMADAERAAAKQRPELQVDARW